MLFAQLKRFLTGKHREKSFSPHPFHFNLISSRPREIRMNEFTNEQTNHLKLERITKNEQTDAVVNKWMDGRIPPLKKTL